MKSYGDFTEEDFSPEKRTKLHKKVLRELEELNLIGLSMEEKTVEWEIKLGYLIYYENQRRIYLKDEEAKLKEEVSALEINVKRERQNLTGFLN